MKIRVSIFWLIVVVVVLIALVLWFGKKYPTVKPLTASVKTNVVLSSANTPSLLVSAAPIHTNALPTPPATNTVQTPLQTKWEQVQPILATQNNVPIAFYGRIVDQFDNAVADATINFNVGVYNGYESTEKRGQVTTDNNGFFTITGYKGQNLGIMPEKVGYVLATTGTLFKYSHLESQPFVPNQNNPTVIKMYKLQGAEHLASFNIETHIPVDGSPIRFDLQTGKQVQSGGDLTIRLISSTKPNLQDEYDWQVSIQMNEGGIVQDISGLGLQKMFQAPESGYEPKFNLSFQKGTQQWASRIIDGFYFTSHGNQIYGKVVITIITDRVIDGGVPVTLNGYLNPVGSRNLELKQNY